MITAEEIGYENEMLENMEIDDIRKQYQDGIIIWLNGSGMSPYGKKGSYRCVLDYLGHVKFMEKELLEVTGNQAMIMGAIDAIQCVNKSIRLYVVAPTALGYVTGFKGKGPNGKLMQQLYEIVKEKKCQLTEVQFVNGAESIKRFVYSCNPDKKKLELYEKQQEDKRNRYKEIIYDECISKVVQELLCFGVEKSIIEKIRNIKP